MQGGQKDRHIGNPNKYRGVTQEAHSDLQASGQNESQGVAAQSVQLLSLDKSSLSGARNINHNPVKNKTEVQESQNQQREVVQGKKQQINKSAGEGCEEEDILLNNSQDEFNPGQGELLGSRQQQTQQLSSKEHIESNREQQFRYKNEKSLSLHDPNIDKEFLRKIQSIEITRQALESSSIHGLGKQDLLVCTQSHKERRDLSIHSLNHQNSNNAQNDSASKQSKIPSQMMQDYETKPLRRQSSQILKVKSRNSDSKYINNFVNIMTGDSNTLQQFDTDNPFKRKKTFSIYDISNNVLDPSAFLQDQSKNGNTKKDQRYINKTPSKKQLDEICGLQIEGGNNETKPQQSNRSSNLKNSLAVVRPKFENQVRPQDLFESPASRSKNQIQQHKEGVPLATQGLANQASLPSDQLNPLDTPDDLAATIQSQQQKKIIIQTRFPSETKDFKNTLRNTGISEVINENSEFELQQNKLQEKLGSPYAQTFKNQMEPVSARTPALQLREQPAYLARNNSVSKVMDLQRKSFDMPYLTSRRPTHHLHSFFSKQEESKEVQSLKQQNEGLQKQLRDQNADFIKQKALLEQQVHLLTQQLSIEQERSKNLKKNYSAALAAFKQKKRNSSGSSSPKLRQQKNLSSNFSQSPRSSLMNGSNLSRQLAQQELKKSFSNQHNRSSSFVLNSYMPKADPWSAKKIDLLQKDNKDLQLTIKRLEELLQATKEQSKNQNSLMYHKEQEILQLQANIIEYETKLNTNTESKIQSVVKNESIQTKKLEQEIKKLKEGQERKIAQSIEEYQARNVLLNDQIIDYQTQIKNLNNEINTHMARLNMKEQSFRALEQQVMIYETQLHNIQKEHSKAVEEYEIKIQSMDKDHNQVHNVLRQLREQYEKESNNKKLPKKFSAIINSSNDNMFCQSNYMTENPQPEETIKFASSANNSTHQFETSIQHDRESNLNGQRNILTTEALGNASTIPVDRVFSDLSKSNLEIQTCIAQVHIFSKEKQAMMQLNKNSGHRHKPSHDEAIQANGNMELVIREPDDYSIELKDRDGVGISPIVRGQASHTLNSITDQEIIPREKRDPEDSIQNDLSLKKYNKGSERKNAAKFKADQRSPTFNDKPLKLSSYWANEEQFRDDGTCSLENVNGLRRQIANLRNKRNKLMVKFNNLKHDSLKEIKRLERQIANMQQQLKNEKDKRVDVQLQKIEQSSALYEAINEKSSKINQLKQKLNEVETEKDEMQSMSHNYLGLATRLSVDQGLYQHAISGFNKLKGRDLDQPSVYQSQQLYNLKGMPKSATRQQSKNPVGKRHSDSGGISMKSMKNLNIDEIRQKFMEECGQNQGAMTQRPPSRDTASKQMKRYMTERPCLESNSNNDFNPLSNEDINSPPMQFRDGFDNQQFNQFQTSLNQGISFQEHILKNELLSDEEDLQLRKIEKANKLTDQRSPEGESRQQALIQKSPVSFLKHNHLGQSRMLTMKSHETQQFNNPSMTGSINKINSASKPPNGILKKSMAQQQDESSRNALLMGRPPQQNIHSYKSPENRKSPITYLDNEAQSQHQPNNQGQNITKKSATEIDNNVFDSSAVNIMSPPAAARSFRKGNNSPPIGDLRSSVQNQILPKTGRQQDYQNMNAETFNDLVSNDSEKDLDVGQENQGENQRPIHKPQGHQYHMQQTQRDGLQSQNLQFASKVNVPNTTVNQNNNKNIFYQEMHRNRLQKVQSPQNSNYKQFLSQNSESKFQNQPLTQSTQSLMKPQIIQKPKIQSYLTQNLPQQNNINQPLSLSERKPKGGPAEHLIKKTLVSKNLADRSHFCGNQNTNQGFQQPNDQVIYTARAGIKAYVSPTSLMDNARRSSQKKHKDAENQSNRSHDPNDSSQKKTQRPQNYYNKATSYLSSQKMTPNTITMMTDNQNNSGSQGGQYSSDQKNSYSYFGGTSNQRALNSFFSQASNQSANLKQGSGTPSSNQRIAAAYNVMTEESTSQNQKQHGSNQQQQQQYLANQSHQTDMRKKMFATGRLSKQSSNTSYDSNMSQTVRQGSAQKYNKGVGPAGAATPGGTNRQSTAQQMYQAYKNKYLAKK